MLEQAQDDSFKILAEKIYNEPKNTSNLSLIEELRNNKEYEAFSFYENIINSIQSHPLSKSIEPHIHNIKVMSLEHCFHEMIYIKIDEFLKENKESTLFSLREKNKPYEDLVNRFCKKIEVATAFLSAREFILQEIERIKTIFLYLLLLELVEISK